MWPRPAFTGGSPTASWDRDHLRSRGWPQMAWHSSRLGRACQSFEGSSALTGQSFFTCHLVEHLKRQRASRAGSVQPPCLVGARYWPGQQRNNNRRLWMQVLLAARHTGVVSAVEPAASHGTQRTVGSRHGHHSEWGTLETRTVGRGGLLRQTNYNQSWRRPLEIPNNVGRGWPKS